MNESAAFELIGRLYLDLRIAAARIQQLEQQLAAAKQPEPPPDGGSK